MGSQLGYSNILAKVQKVIGPKNGNKVGYVIHRASNMCT